MPNSIDSTALSVRLKRTLLKKRLVLVASGLLLTAAAVLVVWILLSFVAGVAILPVGVKIALLTASGLLALFLLARFAFGRFFSGDVESTAIELETMYPGLKGRLIAALQFARMKTTPGYSSELMSLTEQQALQGASNIDFNRVVTFYPILKTGRFFVVAAVLAVALLLLMPGLFSFSYQVYSNPTSVVAPPLGYRLVAFPGSVEWVKYRDIDVGAAVFGDNLPGEATVFFFFSGGSWQQTEVDLAGVEHLKIPTGDSVAFAMTLRQINKSFDYYVKAGRVETDVHHVDVVDRPRVTGIKLSVFYPDYTGLSPTVIDENNGSFSAVVGSRVNTKISTNLTIESAGLVFDDSSRVPLEVSGNEATGAFVVDKSRSYFVGLRDHLGEKNPDPIEYHVTAIADEYPSIEVLRPGFDVNLTDEMMLPLKVRILDDFGFSSLVLKYSVVSQGRQSDENVAVLHFSERIKTEGDIEFNWDLDPLSLFPGDFVTYYFEVADNDRVSGPKVTRSRQFLARLPSLEEIVAEAETESAERISGAESLLRSGRELSERLKNVARKLQAKNAELQDSDWQNQKELETVISKNAEMVDEIEQMAEQMEKSIEELSDKTLLSREILEKLMQVQKLFEEVATPQMKEAQQRLMEALQDMDPQHVQKALKDFQMSQQELIDRLERTLALLKKLQLEQKMETMTRQVEQMAQRQESINEQTESSPEENLSSLSGDEESLKQDLESLQQDAAGLDSLAQNAQLDQSPDLEKFKQALQQTTAPEHMQSMADAMNQQEKQQAGQQGDQALTQLMQMVNDMQQAMEAMKGGTDEETLAEMRTALEDANHLSHNQEQLYNESAETSPESMLHHDQAASQQDMAAAVAGLKNRIAELGKKSPFIAAELQRLVDNATMFMDKATQEFDANNGPQAMSWQREAMSNLNRASIRLMESLNQQQEMQSGSNCNKNTANMQGLSQRQQQLNQQTQQMMNQAGQGQPGGPNGREMLERMAGEQGSIRKSLEELSNEFGQSRQILGRLDDIAREMKQVEEALESGEVGSSVTERQLKIYSRMLEASRSLYRKDFSEQRQSRTPTDEVFHVPPELSRQILDDRVNLEDRLRRYLGDNYPRQYEEQIKAYFRALLQIEANRLRQNDLDNNAEPTQP